jgi:hypothetical protein
MAVRCLLAASVIGNRRAPARGGRLETCQLHRTIFEFRGNPEDKFGPVADLPAIRASLKQSVFNSQKALTYAEPMKTGQA